MASPYRRQRSNANGFTRANWLRTLLMQDMVAGAAMADTTSMDACLEMGATTDLHAGIRLYQQNRIRRVQEEQGWRLKDL